MDKGSFVERYEQSWHRLLELRTSAGQARDAAAHDLAQAWARAWNRRRDLTPGTVEDDVLDEAERLAHRRGEGDPVAASADRPPFERIVALGASGRRRTRRLQLVGGAAALALAAGGGVVVWRVAQPGAIEGEPPTPSPAPTSAVPPRKPPIVSLDERIDPTACSADAPRQWADLVTRASAAAVPSREMLGSTYTDLVLADAPEGTLLADMAPLPGQEAYGQLGLETRVSWRPRGGSKVLLVRWLEGMPLDGAVRNGRAAFTSVEKGGRGVLRWFDLARPVESLQERVVDDQPLTFHLGDDALHYLHADAHQPAAGVLSRIDLTTGTEDVVLADVGPGMNGFAGDHFAWVSLADARPDGGETIPHLMSLVPGHPQDEADLPPATGGRLLAQGGWLVGLREDRSSWAMRPGDAEARTFATATIGVAPGDQGMYFAQDGTSQVQHLTTGTSASVPAVHGLDVRWGHVIMLFGRENGSEPYYALVPVDKVPRLC